MLRVSRRDRQGRDPNGQSALHSDQIDASNPRARVSCIRRSTGGCSSTPTAASPSSPGSGGAIVGTFYALLVCFLISFPIGIAAAIYLEEFAPKNRWTDLIEVNINNLAAVPSIVFGLLGLAVFIDFFGLPRSAPLVGGMVLALMTLPTIIIATRAALKAVPPSIREAALGIGASKHQTVLHHVLPLAMPGIMTGTIIGLAHALGETAPLLLIGMNAFIPERRRPAFSMPRPRCRPRSISGPTARSAASSRGPRRRSWCCSASWS